MTGSRQFSCAAVAAIVLAGLAHAPFALAAKRAPWDLRVASVGSPPATAVTPGATIPMRWEVRRTGRAVRGARIAFLLSRDARAGRGDLALGRATALKPLRRKRRAKGLARVRVPAASAAGVYRVLACVRQPKRRRDRRPGNDCRAARGKLTVAAVTTGPGPAPSGTPSPAPVPGNGAPIPGLSFPRPANPLDVTPVLDDESTAESARITTAGGELTATSSSGTTYVLTFPPDALYSDARITMTPVVDLDGAPFSDGLVGAVRLEPEGLTLNKPAILEILPPDDPPAPDRWVGFTAEGDGRDLHLHVLDPAGGLQLPLLHFSVPGVANGGAQGLADRMPARSLAQYEHLVRDAVANNRGADAIADVLLGYYRDIVRPAMIAALTSDEAVNAGLREGMGWMRQVSLLADGDPRYDAYIGEIYRLMSEILNNAADRAYARCVDEHDFRAVTRMVSIERTLQLLGLSENEETNLYDRINRCVRFELDMDSSITTTLEDGGYTYHLQAQDVMFGGAESGQGELAWLEFSGGQESSDVCDYHYPDPPDEPDSYMHSEVTVSGRTNSVIKPNLRFDMAPRQEGVPEPDPLDSAFLVLDTGSPLEKYRLTITGDCGSNSGDIEQSVWEAFFAWGADGVEKTAPITVFTRMERGSGNLLLRQGITAGLAWEETTVIDVWHRPQR